MYYFEINFYDADADANDVNKLYSSMKFGFHPIKVSCELDDKGVTSYFKDDKCSEKEIYLFQGNHKDWPEKLRIHIFTGVLKEK